MTLTAPPASPERLEAPPSSGRRFDPARLLLSLAAPALALAVSLLVASAALLLDGNDPIAVFREMVSSASQGRTFVGIINTAVPLFLSATAVAVGFQMGLFNIGVEGQLSIAALCAAAFGAAIALPQPLHLLATVLVAMAVGAAWSGIAGILRVTRGVSEVISTIMLNIIAGAVGAYLLGTYFREEVAGSLNLSTAELPDSGRLPPLDPLVEGLGVTMPRNADLGSFLVVAGLVGVGYHLLVRRSRFGFNLRASGLNPTAATASGVSARRMILLTMLLSGALAGLVGMPQLLSDSYQYGLDFPVQLGFTGIGIALLGRNSPVGMAFGALLFAFLERSSAPLQFLGVPPEIYVIMQGTIVLSVVIAYEVVRRIGVRRTARAVAPTGSAE